MGKMIISGAATFGGFLLITKTTYFSEGINSPLLPVVVRNNLNMNCLFTEYYLKVHVLYFLERCYSCYVRLWNGCCKLTLTYLHDMIQFNRTPYCNAS